MYGDAHWIAAANYTGPKRFRQCGTCRGAGELPGQDTWDSDAIANSTVCPDCQGHGGLDFPLHALNYDVLPQLAKVRAAYLRDRYDSRPAQPAVFGAWPARCEYAAKRYGEVRAAAMSPVCLPYTDQVSTEYDRQEAA